MSAYRSIVVGTDGSATALRAVQRAAQVARDAQARLVIVSAYTPASREDVDDAEEALGDERRRVGGLPRVGQVDPLQGGMIPDPRRCISVGDPPEVLSGVHVDRGYPPVWRPEHREPLGSSETARHRRVVPVHHGQA